MKPYYGNNFEYMNVRYLKVVIWYTLFTGLQMPRVYVYYVFSTFILAFAAL